MCGQGRSGSSRLTELNNLNYATEAQLRMNRDSDCDISAQQVHPAVQSFFIGASWHTFIDSGDTLNTIDGSVVHGQLWGFIGMVRSNFTVRWVVMHDLHLLLQHLHESVSTA